MKLKAEYFKLFTDFLGVGVLAFNEGEETCVYINGAAREILEIPPTEEKPLKLSDLFPTEHRDGFTSFSQERMKIDHLNGDFLVKKPAGRVFVGNIVLQKIPLDGQMVSLVSLRDVTFQKKMERDLTLKQLEIKKTYEELLEQNKALRDLDKAKDKFIALTTHELRTPLSAVLATADVLYNKLYDNQEQLEMFIASIHHEGQHLLEIVNDILDFSKIQAGKMDFFIEEFDAQAVVASNLVNFENMAKARNIDIVVKPSANPIMAFFDKIRMNQIISNIVSNAVKFNRVGGKVTAWVECDEEKATIFIQDQGQGIPLEMQSKVFNEFETVGNIKTHQKGTGLGMPISKRMTEAMGGTLTFKSEMGKGTTFMVTVPRKKVLTEDLYRQRPDFTGDLAA